MTAYTETLVYRLQGSIVAKLALYSSLIIYITTIYYSLYIKQPPLNDFWVYYAGGASVNPFQPYPYHLYDAGMTEPIGVLAHKEHIRDGVGYWLDFTYPPFAALAFIPLTVLDVNTAGMLFNGVSALLAFPICWMLLSMVADYRGYTLGAFKAPLSLLLASAFVLSAPMQSNFTAGQVNVVLLALIIYDLYRPATRIPRGVLIGIAAGIKVTPLAFILLFLVMRRYRSALWILLSFAGTVLFSACLLPGESYAYWSSKLWNTERVGDPRSLHNISIQGMIAHLMERGMLAKLVYLTAALGVVALSVYCLRAVRDMDRRYVLSGSLMSLMILLVTPISWFHHGVSLIFVALVCAVIILPDVYRLSASRTVKITSTILLGMGSLLLVIDSIPLGFIYMRVFRKILGADKQYWMGTPMYLSLLAFFALYLIWVQVMKKYRKTPLTQG